MIGSVHMSGAKIACCPPNDAPRLWLRVKHLIVEAMRRGDMGSFEEVERDVLGNNAYLWVAIEDDVFLAVAVTKVTQGEKERLCTIVACGGEDFQRFGHLIKDLEDYARTEGCQAMEVCGRAGWVRLLSEYRPVKVILRKEL